MKTFSIDLESIEHMAFEGGMASLAAKLSVAEDPTLGQLAALGFGVSQMHMSVMSLRRLHEACTIVLRKIDADAAGVKFMASPSGRGTPPATS